MDTIAQRVISQLQQSEGWNKWRDVPTYLEDTRNFTIYAIWPEIIEALHHLSVFIKRFGYRLEADIPPEGTFTHEIDLTTTPYACVCPIAKFRSSLGGDVLLTSTLNRDARKVDSQWRNKHPWIDEPMPTSFQSPPVFYTYVPKVRVEEEMENTNTSDTATNTRFYAKFDRMNFHDSVPIVRWTERKLTGRWREIMGVKR